MEWNFTLLPCLIAATSTRVDMLNTTIEERGKIKVEYTYGEHRQIMARKTEEHRLVNENLSELAW